MNAPLIDMKAVSRRHDSGVLALEGLSLRVARGEALALLGAPASGKSSVLRLLAGIDRARDGEVLRDGEPLRGAQADVASVHAAPALMPWATAAVNVELPLRLMGSAVLTISDIEGFAEAGGAIGLFVADSRLQFDANFATLQRANLKASSQALRLARTVYGMKR